jgi:hypothetical protein
MIPIGGEFVILGQDKLWGNAQRNNVARHTVPALNLAMVQEEHKKCRVQNEHLFVIVTDERFDDKHMLADNEIVISHDLHDMWMGPLLALMRLYNH